MTKLMTTWMVTGAIAAGGFAMTGCGEDAATPQPTAQQPSTDALPATLIASRAPADAKDVAALKGFARDGDAVVLRGKIGGQKDPLAPNRAIMTVIDASLPTCETSPMDKCPTPWDACCEPSDQIAAKSATVQVVGSDGKPLKVGLKGAGGIEPGKRVVVAGKVTGPTDGTTLVVNATEIAVEK